MERRPFGPLSREVAAIGQGTWYIDDAHRPTAVAALCRGLDLGMTHIDTAEMYGDAEIVVGEAIAGLPRFQGPAEQCLRERDSRGLRALALTPAH